MAGGRRLSKMVSFPNNGGTRLAGMACICLIVLAAAVPASGQTTVLLGVGGGRSSSPADLDLGQIGMISVSSIPGPDGKRVTEVSLSGNFGQTSFTVDEKDSQGVFKDANTHELDYERLRRIYTQHIQKSLGFSDEEWKALAPRLKRVQRLREQLGNLRPGRHGAAVEDDLGKARVALAKVLGNKDASVEEVKAALQTVTEAETKVRAELTKAEADVRELVTMKQEAFLVHAGMIE